MKKYILPLLIVLLVAIVLVLVLSAMAKPAESRPFFSDEPESVLVIAHRGGKGLWPENTLYAFREAARLGVEILEMDIHSTKDGVLVVIHDDTVDRTTDGSGAVQNYTLEELRKLDAAYRWTNDDGASFPYRSQGIQIPTLEEVLLTFSDMRLNIEIKPPDVRIAEKLCEQIRASQSSSRVLIASFHSEVIQAFREKCPEVATSAGEEEIRTFFILNIFSLTATYTPPAQAFQVPEYSGRLHILTPKFIRNAHRRNVQVHAWTINDAYTMTRLIEIGVDGIITDYPDLLLDVLKR